MKSLTQLLCLSQATELLTLENSRRTLINVSSVVKVQPDDLPSNKNYVVKEM